MYCAALDADRGYVGVLAHNPLDVEHYGHGVVAAGSVQPGGSWAPWFRTAGGGRWSSRGHGPPAGRNSWLFERLMRFGGSPRVSDAEVEHRAAVLNAGLLFPLGGPREPRGSLAGQRAFSAIWSCTRMNIELGDYINGALVLITLWVAWQAKRSADAAAAELALARRPLVLISEWKVEQLMGVVFGYPGPCLMVFVTFEDSVGVPSTLHSTKIRVGRLGTTWDFTETRSATLVYKSQRHEIHDGTTFDPDAVEPDYPIAEVRVTYRFSAEGDDRCQEWACGAYVMQREGGEFYCLKFTPHVIRDDWREERERRQYWRRLVKWWTEWWTQ